MNSLKDLEGKSVGVASAGSGTQVSVKMILKHYGISVKENELGLNQSAQRLADGQLDAFFYAGGTPFAALIQLGSQKDLSFIISQLRSEKKSIKLSLIMLSQKSLPERMRQSATTLQQLRSMANL